MPLFIYIPSFVAAPPVGTLLFTPIYPSNGEQNIPNHTEIIFGISGTGTQQLDRSTVSVKVDGLEVVKNGQAIMGGYSFAFQPGHWALQTGEVFNLHVPNTLTALASFTINVSYQSLFPIAFNEVYTFTAGDFSHNNYYSGIAVPSTMRTTSTFGPSSHTNNQVLNRPIKGLFIYGKATTDRYYLFDDSFRKELPVMGTHRVIGFSTHKGQKLFDPSPTPRFTVLGTHKVVGFNVYKAQKIFDTSLIRLADFVSHANQFYFGDDTDALVDISNAFTITNKSITYSGIDTTFEMPFGAISSQSEAIMQQTNSGAPYTFPTLFGPKFGAKVLDNQDGPLKIQKRLEDA